MLEAAWWGLVGGGALLFGALIGVFLPTPARLVGLVMAFGAGVLVSALSFELAREAYDLAGGTAVVVGLLAGSLVFFVGVSLLGGGSVGLTVVAAVFLSNVPEALSASTGMRAAGRSTAYIMGLWLAVTLASTIAAALGYGLLRGASPLAVAVIEAFAAGAILTMLADTMLPEAVDHAGPLAGVLAAVGFTTAFLLSAA